MASASRSSITSRWDSAAQFWHEYYVVPFSAQFAEPGFDPGRWAQADVSAESRYALGYSQSGLLMAPRATGIISLRSLCIPREVFARTADALSRLPPPPLSPG